MLSEKSGRKNGLLFLSIAVNMNPQDNLDDTGKSLFNIGKTEIGIVGVLSMVKAFTIFKHNKNMDIGIKNSKVNDRVSFMPFIGKDNIGALIVKIL